MQNIFDAHDVAELVARMERLTPATTPQWGTMTVDQMLAHCNVAYEMVYEHTHPRPNAVARLLLRLFVKQGVVGPKPYRRGTLTAPAFKMTGKKDFVAERARLIAYLHRVQAAGADAFHQRESLSFGPLTSAEWNVLFAKHLDHHLTQFGV